MSAEQTVRIDGSVIINGTASTAMTVAQVPPAKSGAPTQANVLAGSATGPSGIISLIAGEVWYGYLQLSASLEGATQETLVTINTSNLSAVPAPDVDLVTLNLATGTATDAVTMTARTNYMYIYANGDTDLSLNITGDPAVVSGSAYGFRLA